MFTAIAKAADISVKPWIHSVVPINLVDDNILINEDSEDYFLRIESRDMNGERFPENDIELEIYKSGNDVNIMLSWSSGNKDLILWQGSHSFWMNAEKGIRCSPPPDSSAFESLARRIRALLN